MAVTEILLADLHNPVHASALVSVLNAYALDEMGGGEALPEAVQKNLPQALAERPGSYVILAFVDGQPAGLLNAFEGFSTFACLPILNIHDVAVMPAFRGLGLARLLLQKVEAIGREMGACKLTMEVLQGNERAKSVYQKAGFAGYSLAEETGEAMFWQKKLK